ncbi:MAG: mechanosensitive ion channel family protein [Gammaproteobacteria bacterium]|nr:mechanosensitive ion channel family protein [Gammaproteobacteria bacterium]
MEDFSQLQPLITEIQTFLVKYGFQIIGALIILLIGFYVAGKAAKYISNFCESKGLDVTLSRFIGSIARLIVIVFIAIIICEQLNIPITPMVAALGAAALGLSLAVQAPIANYAAGLAIIFTRPFVIDNTIKVQNVCGIVDEIKLAYTILKNEDNERITIPNRQIVGEIIVNSFANSLIEGVVGISYEDNPQQAIREIEAVLAADPDVTKDPKPQVGLDEFADSSLNIAYRYWAPTEKLHQVRYRINLAIHTAITTKGINIPFPQRDVHLHSQPPV